jgi:hypothetical protein
MSDIETGLGPVDYLVVEWPAGKEPNGRGLDVLVDLTERGLIRVLDLAFVQKQEDGSIVGLALADIDGDGELDLLQFDGASSGVLDQGDLDEAGSALEIGASAAILVYENRWAAPFASAVRSSGAELVARGAVPIDALIETLDALDAAQV